jgi:hypothetical protein
MLNFSACTTQGFRASLSSLAVFAVVASGLGASWAAAATTTTTTTGGTATPAQSQSVTTAKQAAPKLWEKITASYAGLFAGPSLGNPSDHQPDDQGIVDMTNDDTRIVLQNALSMGYRLNPKWTIGPTFSFNYYPVFPASEQSFSFGDPFIKLSNGRMVQQGNWNMAGDFRLMVPVTSRTQSSNLITYLRASQSTSYSKNRWTLGVSTYERVFLYSSESSKAPAKFELFAGPFVQYQLGKTTALTLNYSMDAVHAAKADFLDWSTGQASDLSMGLSWDITPRVNFNPFLTIYPGGKISLDSTQLGFYFSAGLI